MTDVNDYISYRLEKAREAYSDAKLLAQNNSWNSCVNRLYYACFYSVSALLIKNNFEARSHNGIRTIFFKEFIKTEIVHKDFGRLYSDLFDWRNKGDYSDFIDFSEPDVLPLLDKAGQFIGVIEKIIK
ncbi:MAG: HEPN domain-containing protein [Ignavibacteriales bacterium]|nr:MAG: HEPN domain-containing protein [Ignavibacteriales bacterium]